MTIVSTRLAIAWLALIAFCALSSPAMAQSDRGIGGTGAPSAVGAAGTEFGGTRYLGEITDFGSIVVNGTHIGYDPDTPFLVDGVRTPVSELRLGQIVVSIVRARARSAERIELLHEVVGAVDAVSAETRKITVLGQTVALPANLELPMPGERVAVNGFRRSDGVILARRLEAPPGEFDQVVGLLTFDGSGKPNVAALPITGARIGLRSGARVAVRGRMTANGFKADVIQKAPLIPRDKSVRRLSVEGFITRKGSRIRFADGAMLTLSPSVARADASVDGLATVTIVRDANGSFAVTSLVGAGAGPGSGGGAPASPAPPGPPSPQGPPGPAGPAPSGKGAGPAHR